VKKMGRIIEIDDDLYEELEEEKIRRKKEQGTNPSFSQLVEESFDKHEKQEEELERDFMDIF